MESPALRRLRNGLVGLGVLAVAGVAQPVLAVAAPTPSPSAADTVQPTPVTATSYARSADPFALTVSPARLVISPGAVDQDQAFTVVNRGQDPVSLTVQARNFVAAPDGGLTYLPDAPYGAADWIHLSRTRLVVQPGTSQQVDATVTVPPSPESGDHQAALVFLMPASGSGNVRVNRGIGAPVYLTVPGPVDDSVRLNGLTGPGWSWSGTVDLTASLTSTGTVHRDFRGAGALAVGTPAHLTRFSDFTVSRGADRVVTTAWEPPLVCICHPSATVTNADGVPQTLSAQVVVLPWWLAAGVLLILVVVGSGLVLRSRRRLRAGPAATGKDAPLPT